MNRFILALFFFPIFLQAQLPTFSWLRTWASNSSIFIEDIKPNIHGQIYVVGRFTGIVDFDPAPGTFTLAASGASANMGDGFILRLDAAGQFMWAGAISGNNMELCLSVDFDIQGNAYVWGQTVGSGSTDLDPGQATHTTTSSDFIIKLNSQNQLVWAKSVLTNASGSGLGCMMLNNNHLYLTSRFTSTVDFDPGPNVNARTSTNSTSDFFLIKLDLNGNFVWVVTPDSSTAQESPQHLYFDKSGDVYISGVLTSGSVDFDPSSTAAIITQTFNNSCWFVVKYNNGGTFGWVKSIDQAKVSSPYICSLDSLVYVYASFYSQYDFDLGAGVFNLSPVGGSDCVIMALDLSGNFKWAKQIGGAGTDATYQIKSPASGKLYLTGRFSSTVDFEAGPGIFNVTSSGLNDIFLLGTDSILNLTAFGNIPSPVQHTAGTSSIRLATAHNGDIFMSGHFDKVTDFDPSSANYSATPTSSASAFLFKLSECPSAPLNLNAQQALYLCSGSSTTISATSTASINWYSSPTSTASIGAGFTFITPVLSAGSYTWYAAASTCPLNSSRLPVIVNVTDPPSFSLTPGSFSVCAGFASTVSVIGAANYTWSPGGAGSAITFTPTLGSNSFTVSASDPILNCTTQKTFQIQGMQKPVVSASANHSLVCAGQTLQLTASGANSFQWSPGGSGAVITATAGATTIYTVSGSNAPGCSSSVTLQVQVVPGPVISINAPTLICKGAVAVFTASGADSYQWNGKSGISTFSIVAIANASVDVKGTNTLTSCSASLSTSYVTSACTSINDGADFPNQTLVYPNPTSGKLYFTELKNVDFRLFDAIGVYLGVIEINDKGEADISAYAAGRYFLLLKGTSNKPYTVIKE